MVYSLIHPGSGLGNQLFRIVAGKVLALDKGYEYSAIGREHFKGKSFMNLDFGPVNNILTYIEQPAGKISGALRLWEEKTNYYNPEFNFIEDDTIIDGEFQSSQYFGHHKIDIGEWLKVESINIPDDVCVIGFRGGEFYVFPELGLSKEYFGEGIRMMKKINPEMKFEVHTDDENLARQFFPNYKIIHNVGVNWRSMRYAKYAIIANSSFYILPRLLRDLDDVPTYYPKVQSMTIAPRYWARRNTKEWSRPDNYYSQFLYV